MLMNLSSVHRVFRPVQGRLFSTQDLLTTTPTSEDVGREIKEVISQKNYPCIAALRSYHTDEFKVGLYGQFGTGESWHALREDLLNFVEEQKKTTSIYLTFWAVFEGDEFGEDDFEKAMWNELSHLTSAEERDQDWQNITHSNPDDKAFRFSLGGTEFFVVGLHAKSARLARQFSKPALVFNVFNQFEQLEQLGQYDAMVNTNRQRDRKFQGNVNPMVEQYGDSWEAIQFSGKASSSEWKCPFHFLKKRAKP
jgi:FPC/CPF motif-containing protein YcgG